MTEYGGRDAAGSIQRDDLRIGGRVVGDLQRRRAIADLGRRERHVDLTCAPGASGDVQLVASVKSDAAGPPICRSPNVTGFGRVLVTNRRCVAEPPTITEPNDTFAA